MEFELKNEDRKSRESCSKAIAQIEKAIQARLDNGREITCEICNIPLESRFRTAVKVFTKDSKVIVHPVHIHCIEDHRPISELFGKDCDCINISSLDLLTINGLVDYMTELNKEGILPPFSEDDLKEEDPMCHIPTTDTKGEPFYTMVEILKGKHTGMIESQIYEREQMFVLYVSKSVAELAKKSRGKGWKDYHVAGISKQGLNYLLNSPRRFMVVLKMEGSKAITIPLTGEEIKEGIQSGKWLTNIVSL